MSVFLNAHEVDEGSAAGVDEDVDDDNDLPGDDNNQDGANRLQSPVYQVELHVDYILVFPFHSFTFCDSLNFLILFPYKSTI